MDDLTTAFRIFIAERPAISPARLAQEINVHFANLNKIINGGRNIPKPRRGDFVRIMEKYGWHFQ